MLHNLMDWDFKQAADGRVGHDHVIIIVEHDDAVANALQDGLAAAAFGVLARKRLGEFARAVGYALVQFAVDSAQIT